MKKLILCLLIMVMMLPALSVSAAKVGGTNKEQKISTKAVETRYDASQLSYEIRNGNDVLVESGNLGSLVTSTSSYIVDMSKTGQGISLKPNCRILIYPTGTSGFYVPVGKHYYVYSNTGSNSMAMLCIGLTNQEKDRGYVSREFPNSFGTISERCQNIYKFSGSSGSQFKLELYNLSPSEPMCISRLEFATFDN